MLPAAQIRNLVEKADRDEVKVPMRVLRDEISRIYFSSPQQTRHADVEALFQVSTLGHPHCLAHFTLQTTLQDYI